MSSIKRLWQALQNREFLLIIKDPELSSLALGLGTTVILLLGAFSYALLIKQGIGTPPVRPEIQAALNEIHEGNILFNPPREIEQGKTERIEARISYQDIGDTITKHLKGRGEPELEPIQVGRNMTVTLYSDDEEFKIKKYSSDKQLVAGRPYAQWEWDVTPLKYGERKLHLKAVINLDTSGEETAYDIPVIDKTINIKVNPAYIAEQAAKDKDIRGLLIGGGSLLGAIGGIYAAVKAWKKRRRQKEEDLKGKPWETVSDPPKEDPTKKPSG